MGRGRRKGSQKDIIEGRDKHIKMERNEDRDYLSIRVILG